MNTLLVNEEIKLSKKGYKIIRFGDNIQNFDIYKIVTKLFYIIAI